MSDPLPPQASMVPSDLSRLPPPPKDGFVSNGGVASSQSATSMSPASIQSGGNCMLRRGGSRKSHKKHVRKSHKKHVRKSHKKHSGKSHRKHRK